MKNRATRLKLVSRLPFCLMLSILLLWPHSTSAQNNTIFGPNVYVFTPSNSVSSINSTLTTLAGSAQFSTNRYAVFFEPGTYTGVEAEVGYYESVAGLGTTPSAVYINDGYLTSNQTDSNGNLTTNFWRSLENMEITAPSGDVLQWGVSQGADFRRMYVNNAANGGMELTNTNCGEASGGFIADTEVAGPIAGCSQQQWYTRNSNIGSFTGNVWNFVFSGVSGAPAQSNPFGTGADSYTTLATTPVVREKPFLYMDSSGNYWVFSPSLLTNSSGTSWANGGVGSGDAGTSLAISTFLIATPSTSLATINSWLATAGNNLILTPGIYQYSGAINVTNPKTVVLGLGFADLVPQTGTAAITVADVDGVQLAGFLIDAGPVNSPVLLQVGVKGASRVSHASNPTSISDVNFRIGGATAGTATIATEIDSDNVIIDNMWSWRADHGTDASWTGNVAINGLVVNGDNVTALGLAVEHYEGEQVEWNGEGGETIFYQSEMPYDVPSQSAWMNGSVDGYASYNVAPTVATHIAYGLGVYSYFNQGVDIIANSGIAAPVADGVVFHDAVTVFLAGSGQITYTLASNNDSVDNAGTVAGSGSITSFITTWGGTSGSCTAVPSVPGKPSGTGTSSSAISVTWGASTAGSSCTVSYNLYRSTTSGFTPSSSNQIASGLTSASYADSGLTAATTYFYIVEAVDGAGSSAASPQGSGTTSGGASCSADTPAPTALTVTATTSSSVSLSWTAPTPPANCTVSSYVVEDGTASPPTTAAASGLAGTTYTVTGLAASTTYYFSVAAVDAFGTSPVSTIISDKTSAATTAPTITTQPVAQTVAAGQTATFSVVASGTPAPTYQWYENSAAISGATASSYTTPATTTANSGESFYVVVANSAGSVTSSTVTLTVTAASCSAVPPAPTGLTATASSSSAIALSWTAPTPPANCTISSYTIYGGTTANPTTVIASGVTGTTYSNTGLAASTTYYYLVKAVDADGTSPTSNQASTETLVSSGGTSLVSIDAGGAAVSDSGGGDNSFVADEDYTGGSTYSVTSTITIPSSVSATAAPAAVYQSARQGNSTYTIPGLTSGSSYNVRLHFAELYFSAAASREFDVVINGTTVLTNFDIYATAGAKDTAVVEQYTATANSSGDIVIALSNGAKDQPMVNGIEVLSTSTACSAVPSTPTNFTATATSSSAIGLSWTAVTPPANCTISSYTVYGGTAANPTTVIATVTSGTTYTNTGLAASTLYYYAVKANDSDGASTAAQAQTTTLANTSCSAVPPAPTGLTATASSSSAIGLSWTAPTPPANCTISSYTVYGGTTANPTTVIASGVTGTTYSNTGLPGSTTYYYLVKAVDAEGISAASNQASTETLAGGSTEVVAIAAGGPAESNSGGGDYSFVADEDFSGGGDNSAVTATINLTQPGANAAPMAVYQHGRAGVSTYTIPGLTAGSTYTVLLHFAETYFTAAGKRLFNVAINGTTVLTNLDIYNTVGKDAALLETFNTTANSSGQIVIQFTTGAADQPLVMGIEVRTN